MDTSLNEFEQAEQVKQWLKKYGPSIVIGILVGIAFLYMWQYWQHRQVDRSTHASEAYDQLVIDASKHNATAIRAQATQIIKDYPKTPYAAMASLILAKQNVADKHYATAEEHLQWVMQHSKISALQQVARLRAARVLDQQQQPQQALDLLNTVNDKSYLALVDQVKGDILLEMGQVDQARAAYQTAMAAANDSAMLQSVLQMKLNTINNSKSTGGAA